MATKQEMIDHLTDWMVSDTNTPSEFNEYHRRLLLVLELGDAVP